MRFLFTRPLPVALLVLTFFWVYLNSLNRDGNNVEPVMTSPMQGVDTTHDDPVFNDRRDRMAQMQRLLGQNSSWFLLRAEVQLADRNMRLYSVLERRNREVKSVVRATDSL